MVEKNIHCTRNDKGSVLTTVTLTDVVQVLKAQSCSNVFID